MKVKKVLLSVILLAGAMMLILSSKTYAATGSWRLGVESIREGVTTKNGAETNTTRYAYQINSRPVLKIVDRSVEDAHKFDRAIYCVRAGKGFGSVNSTMSDVVYNTYYNMVTEKASVNGELNLSNQNYDSILWLLDNIYLPKQTPIADRQNARNTLLKNAFADEFTNVNSFFYDWKVRELHLTDDDIEVVQQWALWYFTNPDSVGDYHTENLPDIHISTTGSGVYSSLGDEGPLLSDWADPKNEGYVRQEEAKVLYNYLINEAKANSTYTKVPTRISINKTLTQTVKQSEISSVNYMIVGPFEITKTGNTPFTNFEGKILDQAENEITNALITNRNGDAISGIRDLSDAVGQGEFYIKIEKSRISNNNISDIKLHISYTTNDTTSTFWTVEGSTVDQPVVVVERLPQDDDDEITVHIPRFDLSLRKYITGVTRNGEKQVVSQLTGRVPNINQTPLSSKTATTAEYKHRKDPVHVQTGDIVEYTIAIYNEGEVAGRATEIVDFLPEGLEFNSAISTDYNFAVSSDKRRITITPKNNSNLSAYNGLTLDSKEIKFTCTVVKKEDKQSENTILTNIAEITESYDENNVKMHRVGDDRDSEPNNLNLPVDADLPGYKGKSTNKPDLTDKDYHYEGQQDDDDFEKLKVSTPEFDLALRKYITGVTRNDSTVSIDELTGRIPNINKEALNAKTTADYKHRKDPVPVQTGDLVNYTIAIYNEGEVAGRATKIVDYLPEGLEFHSAISTEYNFEVSTDKRKITITPKNIDNLDAYNGNKLDSRQIRFTCIVTKKEDKQAESTILTNIAEITECYDINNVKRELVGDDRDSEPNNLNLPVDADLPGYKGKSTNQADLTDKDYHYEGQQDDDDFEKLKVSTPEFDLALRKFITHIQGEEIAKSREPKVDVTPLKDKTGTTATYTHPKTPLVAKIGDTIRYTIRIYNEGEVDGYVTVIEDYLPEELELVPASESAINTKYNWQGSGRTVTTTYLNGQVIKAYDGGDTLDFKDVEIECRIKEGSQYEKILTNIAQINGDSDDDRDSTPQNVTKPTDENLPNYAENQEDDDDYEKVKIYTPGADFALRKFITHIQGETVPESRVPKVDVTPLKNETGTTAIYTHPKNPLIVQVGDIIRYTIRVYNEAENDGKVTVIEDYLPEELELVPASESEINTKYGWRGNGRIVTTEYLKDETIKGYDGGDTLDYKDVEIECRVKDTENAGKILTNIAQINADTINDRDSTPQNVTKPTDENLPNYAENQEDDDDYEKVIIYQPEYDLALRKFITKVNDKEPEESRNPVVDVTELVNGTSTTAKYTHTKEPVLVRNNDIVVYTIRVYNEGRYDGYAQEIKDNIPEGLEFVIDNDINIKYRWKLSDDQKQVSTDYLSKERDENNVIKAFDKETMDTLDYKDVQIAFRVIEPNTSTRVLVNIAEIKNDDGKDIDSTPDNDNPDEDDIDKEYVKLRYFDLALRKFITKVETKTGENLPIETDETKDVSREPKVEIDEEGKIKYIHPKDPVIVANSDVVIYTLRVYNEGTIDGYAEEIKDDVPEGLELIPEHDVNAKYCWIMYDEDGNVTDDVKKAKTIRTTYLSQANSEDNIIKAFDKETMETPDYKEVQVAFRVVEENTSSDRIVINTAEISKDSDDDEDSTPDNDVPDEDDIDKEYIKLKYFDLSLLKWVSKMSVTLNGETKVYETGYNGLENPEPVVKYEIKSSQVKSVVIKYEYGIKITNEGEIPGYAKEISDYIPKGLEFIPEDNPLWTVASDGKIVTTQLENTLLQPGESAMVTVVFKWINDENNFGQFENIAEISKDYNDKDSKDIDSTPDNQIPTEDDQDNAFVLLNPKTGKIALFIILPTIILAILSAGIILIKKYVL